MSRLPLYRVTYAPYTAIVIGGLIALVVSMVTDSVAVGIIVFIVAFLGIFFLVKKLEDLFHENVSDKINEKIYNRIMAPNGNSTGSSGAAAGAAVKKKYREPKENEWLCACGNTNPTYLGKCQCGLRKSEAAPLVAEMKKKHKEEEEARRAELAARAKEKALGLKPEPKDYAKILAELDFAAAKVKIAANPRKGKELAPNEWKCVCGMVNQNYERTCICGAKINDVPKLIEEMRRQSIERVRARNKAAMEAREKAQAAEKGVVQEEPSSEE